MTHQQKILAYAPTNTNPSVSTLALKNYVTIVTNLEHWQPYPRNHQASSLAAYVAKISAWLQMQRICQVNLLFQRFRNSQWNNAMLHLTFRSCTNGYYSFTFVYLCVCLQSLALWPLSTAQYLKKSYQQSIQSWHILAAKISSITVFVLLCNRICNIFLKKM